MGRKKLPIWAVVAADVRAPRDGRYIEDLGRYCPLDEPAGIELKEDRVLYWLEVGAQPTETVRSLLSKQGILLGLHLRRKGKSAEEIEEAVAAHRQRHVDRAESNKKVTGAERRRRSLEAEASKVAATEAKAAEKRRKAAEERKAKEEAAAKAAEARKEPEAAVQVADAEAASAE